MTRQHMFDDDEEMDDFGGATTSEVIESLQEEVRDRDEQIKWLRKNVGTMRRWIALATCGDLSAKAAFEQIGIDIDRIAGPAPQLNEHQP